jgi:hypothetical protein
VGGRPHRTAANYRAGAVAVAAAALSLSGILVARLAAELGGAGGAGPWLPQLVLDERAVAGVPRHTPRVYRNHVTTCSVAVPLASLARTATVSASRPSVLNTRYALIHGAAGRAMLGLLLLADLCEPRL